MKKKSYCLRRRQFLKASVAGAAGAVVGGLAYKKIMAQNVGMGPDESWQNQRQVNPAIDNLRVVFAHDPTMVNSEPVNWTIKGQNDPVNAERVGEIMDRLAIALADLPVADPEDIQNNAPAAWAAIFQQPAGKAWSEVNAAIKINPMKSNRPRLAIIDKMCRVLNSFGVKYSNITLFDQVDVTLDFDSDYVKSKIPAEVRVDRHLGGIHTVTLSTGEEVSCSAGLAEGTIDLMINIAPNKASNITEVGKFNLSMKSHFGSMRYPYGHRDIPGGQDRCMETIIAMNQHDAILGGTPPRQQFCIIDSIWAMTHGPFGNPDRTPYCLVMGTFSPTVDYLTIKKIRVPATEDDGGPPWGMGVTDTVQKYADEMLAGFGYDLSDREINELDFIDALEYASPVYLKGKNEEVQPAARFTIVISIPVASRPHQINFSMSKVSGSTEIRIFNMQGTLIRTLPVSVIKKKLSLTWDGRNASGERVRPGTYIVKLLTGKHYQARKLLLLS